MIFIHQLQILDYMHLTFDKHKLIIIRSLDNVLMNKADSF